MDGFSFMTFLHPFLSPLPPPPFPLFKSLPDSRSLPIVIEDEEGISKGYGFVRFLDEEERSQCYSELDGCRGLGRKAITIKPALAPKR